MRPIARLKLPFDYTFTVPCFHPTIVEWNKRNPIQQRKEVRCSVLTWLKSRQMYFGALGDFLPEDVEC